MGEVAELGDTNGVAPPRSVLNGASVVVFLSSTINCRAYCMTPLTLIVWGVDLPQ